MNYPDNKAADENFENLRKQYAEGVHSIRDVCDESMDVKTFLRQTEDHIRKAVTASEDGLRYSIFQIHVKHLIKLANLRKKLKFYKHLLTPKQIKFQVSKCNKYFDRQLQFHECNMNSDNSSKFHLNSIFLLFFSLLFHFPSIILFGNENNCSVCL